MEASGRNAGMCANLGRRKNRANLKIAALMKPHPLPTHSPRPLKPHTPKPLGRSASFEMKWTPN